MFGGCGPTEVIIATIYHGFMGQVLYIHVVRDHFGVLLILGNVSLAQILR